MAKRRPKIGALWLLALLILAIIYTLIHLFSGERGLFTWHQLNQQVNELEEENAVLRREIARLERQTERLNRSDPDMDFIDETIRRQGPWVKKDEEVLLLPR